MVEEPGQRSCCSECLRTGSVRVLMKLLPSSQPPVHPGGWTKSRTPVNLSVIHHRENSLDPTWNYPIVFLQLVHITYDRNVAWKYARISHVVW
jgi:hypothetical protein